MPSKHALTAMCVGLLAVCAGVQGAFAQAPAPLEARGAPVSLLDAWVEIYNSQDAGRMEAFAHLHYGEASLAEASPPQWAINYRNLFANYGPFQLISRTASSDLAAEALAYLPELDACLRVFVELERPPSTRIEGVYFEPFSRSSCPERTPAPPTWNEFAPSLERYVDGLVASSRFHGVALVRRGGRTEVHEARGSARLSPRRPNTLQTRFELASISKLFTTVAIARLVENERMSLDDTIFDLLPDYPNRETAQQITVRQLLSHTSGLEDYYRNGAIFADARTRTLQEYWPLFASAPLMFQPGSRYEYSNSNFVLLGAIVERVSGREFTDFVDREVFARAGMTRTCYCRPGARGLATPLTVYTSGAGPARRVSPEGWAQVPEAALRPALSAGYSVSTARDLARFAERLLSGALLRPSTLQALLTTHAVMEDGGVRGLGFEVYEVEGHRYFGHGGNSWGVATQIDIYPEADVVVVILSNSETSGVAALRYKTRQWIIALMSSPSAAGR